METSTSPAPNGNDAVKSVENLPTTATTESTASAASPTTTQDVLVDTRATSVEVDQTKPADFEGEVQTNDDIPTPETLKKVEDYVVLDRHGKTHTFKSLYKGKNVARRVLIIFIRHFFCGVSSLIRVPFDCQALLMLPLSTARTISAPSPSPSRPKLSSASQLAPSSPSLAAVTRA
jgi:hypothetical protein